MRIDSFYSTSTMSPPNALKSDAQNEYTDLGRILSPGQSLLRTAGPREPT